MLQYGQIVSGEYDFDSLKRQTADFRSFNVAWGSVTRPSLWCGCYGLRPTFGAVSAEEVEPCCEYVTEEETSWMRLIITEYMIQLEFSAETCRNAESLPPNGCRLISYKRTQRYEAIL